MIITTRILPYIFLVQFTNIYKQTTNYNFNYKNSLFGTMGKTYTRQPKVNTMKLKDNQILKSFKEQKNGSLVCTDKEQLDKQKGVLMDVLK